MLDIINEKKKNSKIAFTMVRYISFIAIYLVVVIVQRNAWDAQSMHQGALPSKLLPAACLWSNARANMHGKQCPHACSSLWNRRTPLGSLKVV